MKVLIILKVFIFLILSNFVAADSKNYTKFYSEQNKNGISCLSKFLNNSLIKTQQITLLTSKNFTRSSNIENDFIINRFMKSDLSIYLVSGNLDYKAVYTASSHAIILIEKPSILEYYKTPELLYLCSGTCSSYIVIFSKPYVNQQSFLADVSFLVKFLWKRRMHNVVVTGLIDDDFLFAKSMKFRPNEYCNPMEPEIIGSSCVTSDGFKNLSSKLFQEIEYNNCIAKISFKKELPFSGYLKDGSLSGVVVSIMNLISTHFNFTIEYSEFLPKNESRIFEGKLFLLETESIFFLSVLCDIRKEYLDCSYPYDVSNLSNQI